MKSSGLAPELLFNVHSILERYLMNYSVSISNNTPTFMRTDPRDMPDFDGVKTEALETALDYIGRGWSPIPVGHQEKKPKLEGWQTLRLGAEDAGRYFNGATQNIGILLGPASGGLTDVDLDCSEAVGLGSYFLPPTDATFGRASKRNSHFLYFTGIAASDDRATIQFKDPNRPKDEDKGMLLEVRIGGGGKGAQSIFPGSTHEEGEEIRWETDGVPAKVEDADLMKAARWVATASLFIRYMPGSGSRHGAFCAIGGFLARCGLTGPEVKLFAGAITAAGGFDRDHIGHAADAAEAHYSGKHSYGYKTIAEVFDEKVARKAAEWLGYKSGSDGAAAGEAFGSFGFNMTPKGLFFTEDPQDPKSKMFICGPFDVLANNRDDASESWGLLLHWKDSDGQPHTWPMPRELFGR